MSCCFPFIWSAAWTQSTLAKLITVASLMTAASHTHTRICVFCGLWPCGSSQESNMTPRLAEVQGRWFDTQPSRAMFWGSKGKRSAFLWVTPELGNCVHPSPPSTLTSTRTHLITVTQRESACKYACIKTHTLTHTHALPDPTTLLRHPATDTS